jgi:hypothetical protein
MLPCSAILGKIAAVGGCLSRLQGNLVLRLLVLPLAAHPLPTLETYRAGRNKNNHSKLYAILQTRLRQSGVPGVPLACQLACGIGWRAASSFASALRGRLVCYTFVPGRCAQHACPGGQVRNT